MLAKNLKRLRKEKGMTQLDLVKKADITMSTLTNIETGVSDNPTMKTLVAIADALDVSVDELIGHKVKE
jgi:transcriptional regulator with XRE-family HTH domain